MNSKVLWLEDSDGTLGAPARYLCDFYVYETPKVVARLVNAVLSASEAQATANSLLEQYGGTWVCVVNRGATSGPPRAPIKSSTVDKPAGAQCWLQAGTPLAPQQPQPKKSFPSPPRPVADFGLTVVDFVPSRRPLSTSFLRPQLVAGLGENSLLDTLAARAALVAWSKTPAGASSSPFYDYGANIEDAQPAWKWRDSVMLRAFRDWWNLSGKKPAATTNTGTGADPTKLTYPTTEDLAALQTWAKEAGVSLPSASPLPPPALPPPASPPAEPPGGGSSPPGGGGGGTQATCGPNEILDANGNCQPKLPPAQKAEPSSGLNSSTGLLIAGAVVVAAVGLFAATVGAGAGAAVASGGGRSENPRLRVAKLWYVFYYERGNPSPKEYLGPFATKADAENAKRAERLQYGTPASAYKVKQMSAAQFQSHWGA